MIACRRKTVRCLHCGKAFSRSRLPQDGVWNLFKRRELKNLCCQDLAHLRQELVLAKERLRHRQTILQPCFTHALAEV